MYPSILINFNGLGEKTAEYERMKKERVKIKHTNKQLSDAYKLVLNVGIKYKKFIERLSAVC